MEQTVNLLLVNIEHDDSGLKGSHPVTVVGGCIHRLNYSINGFQSYCWTLRICYSHQNYNIYRVTSKVEHMATS